MSETRVVCGDALELVGDLGEFDAVITDPPYPIGGKSSLTKPQSIVEARAMVEGISQSFVAGVLRGVRRRDPDKFAVWLGTDWRQVSFFSAILLGLDLPTQCCVVWDKCIGGGKVPYYHASHELVLYAAKGVRPNGYCGMDVVRIPRPTNKAHPFEKPPELTEFLLRQFTPGRILDPFCGGGTVLLGAKRLGWDVVGIDISAEFARTANTRLGNDDHEPRRHRVEGQAGLLND